MTITSHPMHPRVYELIKTQTEAPDVVTITLRSTVLDCGQPAKPGQFYMVSVPGTGEIPLSVSDLTNDRLNITHTIRAVGPTSKKLCKLVKGQEVGVRGPFGQPWPVDQLTGQSLLIIAGGLGIAPLKSIIQQRMKSRVEASKTTLLYGARCPEQLIYHDELSSWRAQGVDVKVTVDFAASTWSEHIGVITSLITSLTLDPKKTQVLVCGPEIMMKFCLLELKKKAFDSHSIYISMERNMQCAIGQCGHCLWGPKFVCKDGPVFSLSDIEPLLNVSEI